MTSREPAQSGPGDQGKDSALDRAAAQGPLPEPSGDDEPGDGTDGFVPDSTEQAEDAAYPGLRPQH